VNNLHQKQQKQNRFGQNTMSIKCSFILSYSYQDCMDIKTIGTGRRQYPDMAGSRDPVFSIRQ